MIVKELEKDIERAVTKRARLAGWHSFKLEKSAPRGFPDRVYARPGRCVFMEFKRRGGTVSPHQHAAMKILRDAGNEVHVVFTAEEALAVLGLGDDR